MRIGIIGAGRTGIGLGRSLAQKGHEVVVSFARSPEKVAAAAQTIGGGSRAGSVEEAANHGEVVIIATPWSATLDAIRPLTYWLAGKIVWDTTNPLAEDMSSLVLGTTTSAGEEVARVLTSARVVKAVPPFAEWFQSNAKDIAGHPPSVFVCSDDDGARETVVALVADLNADGVPAGSLVNARYTEPLGMLLVQLAYQQKLGTNIGVALLRGALAQSER